MNNKLVLLRIEHKSRPKPRYLQQLLLIWPLTLKTLLKVFTFSILVHHKHKRDLTFKYLIYRNHQTRIPIIPSIYIAGQRVTLTLKSQTE